MRKGVVVGKFYPPHRGHKFLIEKALAQVDHLTVIVCDNPTQTIPAELRAQWLREIHPSACVVVSPDDLPDDDSSAWAKRTIEILGGKPDVVFTSEDYGEPYSEALGCEHVQVDKARVAVPISATAIRANPLVHLDFLEPCVRAFYIPRITLVGAESTGKTTLAERLAQHFDAEWVAEYGREYSERKLVSRSEIPDYGGWTTEEFVHIASEQWDREEAAARRAKKLVICDTDAFATGIWHERYMGFASEEVSAIGRNLCNRIYLVLDPSVAFVQDGWRDGEHHRRWMHQRFIEELGKRKATFRLLTGGYENRLEDAIRIVSYALNSSKEEA